MLKTRVLAAMVFTPALLGALCWGDALLAYVCFVLAALLLFEFVQLTLCEAPVGLRLGTQLLGALCAAAVLGWLPAALAQALPQLCFLAVLLLVLGWPTELSQAMHFAGLSLLGIAWCSNLLPCLAALRALPTYGLALALLTVLSTWASDTGAYAFGRAFGRHKLYPAISPSKTWEGALGGWACGILTGAALAAVLPPALTGWEGALLGAICAIAGLVGDLCESMLKRSVGAKDSSRLIPGHGGVFDRFDSILFAVGAMRLVAPWILPPP